MMHVPWEFRLHKGQLRNETRHVKISLPGNTVFKIGENQSNKKFVITRQKKKSKLAFQGCARNFLQKII